ncbi:MAG: phosphoribosyltransferase [Candidatus Andersenbacteria bacterium]|nr:phosphoribosyltransferase [Candidatus Andersenbacteria bacterium]MBI3250691.1 phosphoribosyltransferase [Candidatus Andersenbacteria bacterium]
MSETDVLQLLHKVGAVITDSHIVYTSNKHGSAYVNKDAVYPHTRLTSKLCLAIAQDALAHGPVIQAVIAPAVGGIILSQWTAYHLTDLSDREVIGVYAEKAPESDEFVIKRGYDKLLQHKNVLVVEDILNTGGSVKKVVEAVRHISGNVVAVAALCNRGNVSKEDIGNPPYFFTLANVNMDAWDEAECPLCIQKVPINTEVGKGREFLARRHP